MNTDISLNLEERKTFERRRELVFFILAGIFLSSPSHAKHSWG